MARHPLFREGFRIKELLNNDWWEEYNPPNCGSTSEAFIRIAVNVDAAILIGRIYGHASRVLFHPVMDFLLGICGLGASLTYLFVTNSWRASKLCKQDKVYSHEFGYPSKENINRSKGEAQQGWNRLP